MNELKFDKKELGNLEYSLQREFISTNRAGGYMSSTITCCNTRKYHGLMVCPVANFDDDYFVLLSSIDESVIQHEHSFNLGIHRFPSSYEPKGHKYIVSFDYTPTPSITYRVGGVLLKKEMLWLHSKEQLLIRYTLLEASSPTKLQLRPFLAFRNIHALSKVNLDANGFSTSVKGGVSNCLYHGMPTLYMQLSAKNEFVPAPDWYKDFEYEEEKKRGYHYHEDLLTTGFFEMNIKKGESIVLSCSTAEISPATLKKDFEKEIAKRSDKTEFISCLKHSARQFLIKKGDRKEVVAGYPWLGHNRGRDRLIALAGITLTQGNNDDFIDVIKGITANLKNGLYAKGGANFYSLDGPLWYFWALQMFEKYTSKNEVFETFGQEMSLMLTSYAEQINQIDGYLDENGLIRAASPTKALSWMEAYVEGVPVSMRAGYQVEVNALWYNALCYTLEYAKSIGDKKFVEKWESKPALIKKSFNEIFVLKEGYLADFVSQDDANKYIRPNQVIACSLDYKLIDEKVVVSVLNVIERHLLTAKGLRTLSPDNPLYEPRYEGNETMRSYARHQGSVHTWLLYHYLKASLDVFGNQYLFTATEIIKAFEEDFLDYGVGTLPEVYDGDPPHHPAGAISHAMSVGSLLATIDMIDKFSKKAKK